jgi:hypothetical protein
MTLQLLVNHQIGCYEESLRLSSSVASDDRVILLSITEPPMLRMVSNASYSGPANHREQHGTSY